MTLLEIIYLEPCHNRNADSVKVVNSDQDKEPFEFTIRETILPVPGLPRIPYSLFSRQYLLKPVVFEFVGFVDSGGVDCHVTIMFYIFEQFFNLG